jgi:uncharacterized membrane protein
VYAASAPQTARAGASREAVTSALTIGRGGFALRFEHLRRAKIVSAPPTYEGAVSRFFANLPRRLFLLLMAVGSALITASSLAYFDLATLPPFAIEKLPVRFEALWLASLRVHVACAVVALPLCLALATRTLQRRAAAHRWLGRAAGVIVLFGLVPSGCVLAFDAKGGAPVTAGFLVSAAIVEGCMVHGILAARRRDLATHRRAMAHVVAQMSVAVTSRAMLVGLDAFGMNPDVAYVVALWVPVVGSALVAEAASRSWSSSALSFVSVRLTHLKERIRRALAPFVPGRSWSVSNPFARPGR